MENHICKIAVFIIRKPLGKPQYRCEVCSKIFKKYDALDYIDRTIGVEECRRIRLIGEHQVLISKKQTEARGFSWSNDDEFRKIS